MRAGAVKSTNDEIHTGMDENQRVFYKTHQRQRDMDCFRMKS
jgi:hypothetical protein